MIDKTIFNEEQLIKSNHIDRFLFGAEAKRGGQKSLVTDRSHDSYHIILILSGKMSCKIKQKLEEFPKRTLVIIPLGVGLSEVFFSEDFHGLEIIPSDNLLLDILRNRNPFPGTFRYKIHSTAFSFETTDKERHMLKTDMRNLIGTLGNKEHHYAEELNYAYFYILLTDISNSLWTKFGGLDSDKISNLSRSEVIFKSFFDLLIKNIKTETSISFYANELCISNQHLSSVVKKNVKMPIGAFILKIRYEIAVRLLMNSSLSIQQISSSMNFTDQSAFGKFFKKTSGVSPNTYRKNVKKSLLTNSNEFNA